MPSSITVQKWHAICGCAETVAHRPACRLAHGDMAKHEDVETLRCDAEDGCVWLHLGNVLAPMPPHRARVLARELEACATAAEAQK